MRWQGAEVGRKKRTGRLGKKIRNKNNPLKHSGNYKHHLPYHKISALCPVYFYVSCYLFPKQKPTISLSIKRLISASEALCFLKCTSTFSNMTGTKSHSLGRGVCLPLTPVSVSKYSAHSKKLFFLMIWAERDRKSKQVKTNSPLFTYRFILSFAR
jgi:hypothetical protein